MSTRIARSILAPAAIGAATLVLIAPWLNPCIGAHRFADCMDPRLMSDTEVFNPERWCYWGICDWFPSTPEIIARIAIVLLVVLGAGAFGARLRGEHRATRGVATATLAVVLAVALTWYMYPYAAA